MIVADSGRSSLAHFTNMLLFVFLVLNSFVFTEIYSLKYDFVTWTSTVKLLNLNSNSRLHSHDVKYGSGSGQQSVTAVKNADDHNSYWQVKPIPGTESVNKRGDPIKCGQTIRLYHLSTRRNLHSHLFPSPLSNNQEVSAFGENGEGDDGDNWVVECDDDFWRRDESVRLKHQLTRKYLHVTGDTYGRPIHGQMEVSGYSYPNQLNLWRVFEGVYIMPGENQALHDLSDHTEL